MIVATDFNILFPKKDVKLGGGKIEVHEMAWPDALDLFNDLGSMASEFVGPDGRIKPNGEIAKALAAAGKDVVGKILKNSTDLKPEDIQWLPVSAVVLVVSAALELTLNDEVLNAGNAVAGRIRGAFRPAEPVTPRSLNT